MSLLKHLGVLCALALVTSAALTVQSDTFGPRQYYGEWRKHPSNNYFYRPYYYKPTPTYSGYRHHYVIYYPSRPRYTYYYNPYDRYYWGRCSTSYPVGNKAYSTLGPDDRRGSLDEIAEGAFPAAGPMPGVPESKDGAVIEPPPDDLPAPDRLPK
jgi:hypothetical protein